MIKNKKMIKNNRSQAFSTDIVIVIVLILFGTLFLVINKINNLETDNNFEEIYNEATVESNIIVDNFKKIEILDNENKVDANLLLSLNEDELKQELGITNDFAIVFEKDGKLIKIDPENNINCIGSNKIIVNGQSCS